MIPYLIILLITFSGIFIGLLISYFTQEELKPGKNYFKILMHALFIAILILFFVKNPDYVFFIFIALLIIIYSFSNYRETLYYYTLAVIFFLSWKYNGFTLITPLIFLYSFPIGAIYLAEHSKKKKKEVILGILKQYVGFLIVGVVLGIFGLFL